ncbi:uncharacterized protein [Antedon mediterranea]|uniref:uncharacterized protein n=1 Tax=Antedon mediterranea TaxID=105859 RepID=UPI003AF4CCB5
MFSIFVVILFYSGGVASQDEEILDGLVASQSTTVDGNVASRAIDGNFDTDLTRGSCSLTEGNSFNWWMVDLGRLYSVTTIRVYNRADGSREQLASAVVNICTGSNNSSCIQCGTPFSLNDDIYANPKIERSCSAVSGRYLRVTNTDSPVQLCEVQVFGSEPDICALGNTCDVTNGVCNNNGTNYYCGCNSGYTLKTDGESCTVDLCFDSALNNCDQQHGYCTPTDTDISYKCGCDTNYILQNDNHTCLINACSNSTLNNCDDTYGQCMSNGGDYTCACLQGYTLDSDGFTCLDFDICANSTLNRCDDERGFCVRNGTGYYCGCNPPLYTIHSDGFRCIPVPQSKTFKLVNGDDACLRGGVKEFRSRSLLYCANACLGIASCTGYHYAGGSCVIMEDSSEVEEYCYKTGKTYIVPPT